MNELGIAVRTGVPVQTGVLAGLDPDEIADPTALAEMIRAGIAQAGLEARLGPKVSVVVDGGGRTAPRGSRGRCQADGGRDGGRPVWQVAIAGDARTARTLGIAEGDEAACEAALALLSEIAAMGREARARDLGDRQIAECTQQLAGIALYVAPLWPAGHLPLKGGDHSVIDAFANLQRWQEMARPTTPLISPLEGEMAGRPEGGAKERDVDGSLIGTVELGDGRVALGIALPFGHTTANLLKTFAETARELGIEDIRPAPKRTLVAICGTAVAGRSAAKTGGNAGFRDLARRSQAGDFGLPRRAGMRVRPYPGETDRR